MKVDFNNLRAQTAYRLDDLITKLNSSIQPETIHHSPSHSDGWVAGNLLIDAEDIQETLDDLRRLVLTINSVFDPDNDDFKDMSEHIEKNGAIHQFNPESHE